MPTLETIFTTSRDYVESNDFRTETPVMTELPNPGCVASIVLLTKTHVVRARATALSKVMVIALR